jgi:hypothetical protein
MERLFPSLKEDMKDLPAFLRDTDVSLYLRSYYLGRENPDGTENEAWAFGGWAAYRSGWLFDVFQIGATVYGSAPLYAPDDKDGTTLLKSGQEGYGVLGEAFAALRYKDYAVAKGYRKEVTQGYINREDNRMTPNTFEGLTLGGKLGPVDYLAGYLWKMKARNSDDFVFMSEQAGAADSEDGSEGPDNRAGLVTRATSPRAKGSCLDEGRARVPRGIRPSVSGRIPMTSGWRGSRGPGESKVWTPTWSAAAPTCPRACSISGCSGNTGR